MPIRFVCPRCGRAGSLPDGFPGGKIRCPACKTISRVEGGAALSSVTAAPAAGQIATVADLEDKPCDTQPGTTHPSPAGAASGRGRAGDRTHVGPSADNRQWPRRR